MLKIVIGPVICALLLLLMGGVGFFMFKKKYDVSFSIKKKSRALHCIWISFISCVYMTRQTEGPTGRLYTSPNPEYFSPDEGEQLSLYTLKESILGRKSFDRCRLYFVQVVLISHRQSY